MKRGPIAIDTTSATPAAMRTRITRRGSRSASATTSSPTEREPFTRIASPGRTRREHELDRVGRRRDPLVRPVAARELADADDDVDLRRRRRRPRRGTAAPRARARPSRRAPRPCGGRPRARARCASAARIATGFAFQESLMRRPPPGSSTSWERQRENSTSTGSRGGSTPSASAAVSAAAAFATWWRAANPKTTSRPRQRTCVRPSRTSASGAPKRRTSSPCGHERLQHRRVLGEDRHRSRAELLEQLGLGAGDVFEASEQLEVDGRDRGDHADVRAARRGRGRGSGRRRASPAPSRRPRCPARSGTA